MLYRLLYVQHINLFASFLTTRQKSTTQTNHNLVSVTLVTITLFLSFHYYKQCAMDGVQIVHLSTCRALRRIDTQKVQYWVIKIDTFSILIDISCLTLPRESF